MIGRTGAAFSLSESGGDLLALLFVELLFGADDETSFGIVLNDAAHERGGGEIGFGGHIGGGHGWEAAPEIERTRESFEPNFFGQKDLRFERGFMGAGVTPAHEIVMVDDLDEAVWVWNENAFEPGVVMPQR